MTNVYQEQEDGSLRLGGKTIPGFEQTAAGRVKTAARRRLETAIENTNDSIAPYSEDLETKRLVREAEVQNKTAALIEAGFDHGGKNFKVNLDKETAAIALNLKRMAGADMTGTKFRARGRGYVFTSTGDFDTWFAKGFGRLQQIIDDGSDLKDAIDDATTEAELNAVIDDRT